MAGSAKGAKGKKGTTSTESTVAPGKQHPQHTHQQRLQQAQQAQHAQQAQQAQQSMDSYWTARSTAYHQYQVDSPRAAVDRALWTRVFTTALQQREQPTHATPPPTSRALDILDVGVGSGYLTYILAEHGHRLTGIDTSDGMLATARRAAQAYRGRLATTPRLVKANAHEPCFPPATFDAVVSRFVLWTLTNPVAALHEWCELLRPGGIIACADATWHYEHIDPTLVVQSAAGPTAFADTYAPLVPELPLATALSPDDYVAAFRAAGLTGVTCTPIPEMQKLDAIYGTPPGHESQPHFIICGFRPS